MLQKMIFSAKGLSKSFNDAFALHDINMNVPEGCIYGLVGENGAGKTTLFRIMAGLCEKSSGEYSLFSSNSEKEIRVARKKLGCTIEAPAIYGNMSVLENMQIQCIVRGITDMNRIDEVLSIVGLDKQRNKKSSNLSFGMKQRLALALAILHDPQFLILDEPTNGLDPMGIAEFRELFLRLNKEKNITIVIASHILSELEHLATHYGFIRNGKILEELSAEELHQRCAKYIRIIVDDVPKTILILQNQLNVSNFKINGSTICLYDFLDSPATVSDLLYNSGIRISEFSLASDSLETYYTNVIWGGNKND